MKRLLFTIISVLCAYTVFAQCNPQFTWAAAPQNNNLLRVGFTNTTGYTPPNSMTMASYSINYGDNSSSSMYNSGTQYHNYSTPGTYTAVMTMYVYDSTTAQPVCNASYTQVVTVGYSACGTMITATQVNPGAYTFTATTPAGTSGMTYAWNFGDGNTGSGSPASHTYASAGSYTVTLMATNGTCTYTNVLTLQVSGSPSCANYVASFYASTNNMTGYFSNTSSYSNIATVSRRASWNFGDGNSLLNQYASSASHTYASTGTYTVRLINQWVDSLTQNIICTDTAYQTINITGTTNPGNNIISGSVFFDSLGLTGPATVKVWLVTYDSLANSLSAVDSQSISSWGYMTYSFSNKPAGVYYTKAAITSGQPVGMPGIVPTYHDSSLYWANAAAVYHSGGTTSGIYIWMKNGIVTSGPGFIGGNISLGANKGTATGVPNQLVFLRDNNNKLVRSTYTDINGDYSFGNIAAGTYNIYPEAMNYITIPSSTLTVTNGQPTVTGVDFKKTPTHIKPITTGIANVNTTNVFQLYPNPSNGDVRIIWKQGFTGDASVEVVNMTGSKVFSAEVNAAKNSDLDLSSLQSGVYFIKISTGSAQHVEKLVLQR